MRSIIREYRAVLDWNYSLWFTDIYRVLGRCFGSVILNLWCVCTVRWVENYWYFIELFKVFTSEDVLHSESHTQLLLLPSRTQTQPIETSDLTQYRTIYKQYKSISFLNNILPFGTFLVLYVGWMRERDHLEDPGVRGRTILRWIFTKWDVGVWIESSWLRIGRGGGHLWMR
jgi:hypothetical protein